MIGAPEKPVADETQRLVTFKPMERFVSNTNEQFSDLRTLMVITLGELMVILLLILLTNIRRVGYEWAQNAVIGIAFGALVLSAVTLISFVWHWKSEKRHR